MPQATNREEPQRGCPIRAFWVLLSFCGFPAGWNLSAAAQTAHPDTLVPMPQANAHGVVRSQGVRPKSFRKRLARLLRSLNTAGGPGHGWALLAPRLQLQVCPMDQKGNPWKWKQRSKGHEEGHTQLKPHLQALPSPLWAPRFRNAEGLGT